MEMMKVNPGVLLIFIVFSLLLFSTFHETIAFTEIVDGTTIYFHNTENITINFSNTVIVYHRPTLITSYHGTMVMNYDRNFFTSIIAYDYDFPDYIIRSPKTITITPYYSSYIDFKYLEPKVFTVYSSHKTIYFVHESSTMTIIRG